MRCISRCFATALTATAMLVAPLSAPAHPLPVGQEPPTTAAASTGPRLPQLQMRAFLGILAGAEAEYTVADRLRLRASERIGVWGGLDPSLNTFTDAAAYVRLAGQVGNALWARGGYQYQRLSVNCWDRQDDFNDRAHAFDFGLAYRYQSVAGHLFEAELGQEFLRRQRGLGCNDSGVDASSDGLRVSVLGQFALSPGLGLFARMGMRSADHLLEIRVLPEADVGLAFRF